MSLDLNEKTEGSVARHRAPHTDVEQGRMGSTASDEAVVNGLSYGYPPPQHEHRHMQEGIDGWVRFKTRFMRVGKRNIGTLESLKNLAKSSWLLTFLVFVPIGWVTHFMEVHGESGGVGHQWVFLFNFLAIIPLEQLFEYGGEQMSHYVGKELGDFLVITLNNVVEATLAIILLNKCELRLLQATIIGVIVLHLLLIPGVTFIVGGARVMHQDLAPHHTDLNQALLTVGVICLLLPAAFFAAIDRGEAASAAIGSATSAVTDETRTMFLSMSHGLAVILLVVYICSRVYIHNPPGDDNALCPREHAPEGLKQEERELEEHDPKMSQWVTIAMLLATIGVMAATAEWLVDSIETVRTSGPGITEEWFGMILLPLVSYSADATIAIGFFFHYLFKHFLGKPSAPTTLAKARTIDMAIQFVLFWMPFITLCAWWAGHPLTLLFDLYEVAIIISSCFIVNYVTADAKTNWAEGAVLLAFYLMIALVTWFYTGQKEMHAFAACATIASAAEGGGEGAAH